MLNFTMGQLLCALMIVTGLGVLLIRRRSVRT